MNEIYIQALYKIFSEKSKTAVVMKTFTLAQASMTSASVWNSDGVKIRDLWAVKEYPAGDHPIYWDGLTDEGGNVPQGNYTFKIASNNLQHTWTARIGNTSTAQTGPSVHRMWIYSMVDAVVVGNFLYFCGGYSEIRPSVAKVNINTPNVKINIMPDITIKQTEFICSDGVRVYLGGHDPYNEVETWVNAIKVSDDTDYIFSAGEDFTGVHNRTENAISHVTAANSFITGMEVMKTGNYLFVSRKALNQIQVLNKVTGALVRTLTFTTPKYLRVDDTDKLWISSGTNTIEKFTVNGDGTLTTTGVTITGVADPGYIAVKGTKVLVIDYSTQQIKEYNNITGASVGSPFGRSGGYLTNAIVYDDKFCLKYGSTNLFAFITFNADGSYWFGDGGNNRVIKFSSTNTVQDKVMYLPPTYSSWINLKNTRSVGAAWFEFDVDYTVPQTATSGWSLTRNWGATMGSEIDDFQRFNGVHTFTKNGVTKTFGMIRLLGGLGLRPFEMKPDGTFRMGTTLVPSAIYDIDGNIIGYGRYNFLGFNGAGDPTWSTQYDETFVNLNTLSVGVPLPGEGFRGNPLTDSGKLIIYDYGGDNDDVYHLGAIEKGTNKWLWKTGYTTPSNYFGNFPDPSYYDTNNLVNNYAGSVAIAVSGLVLTGYHGEFWKNSQTNKYNLYTDDGLALIQLGTTGPEHQGEMSPAEMAGNALTVDAFIEPISGDLIFMHGDESWHGALHMWRVSGLDTIETINLSVFYPSQSLIKPADTFIDLMDNVPFNQKPFVSANGWTLNPEIGPSNTDWGAVTNQVVYNRFDNPDITIFNASSVAGDFTLSRDLGNVVSSTWRITGDIGYPNSDFLGGQQIYFDLLDINGIVLSRLSWTFNWDSQNIFVIYNDEEFITAPRSGPLTRNLLELSPVVIEASGSNIKFTYLGVTKITAVDGLINKPKTLRCTITGDTYQSTGRGFAFKDFKLYL